MTSDEKTMEESGEEARDKAFDMFLSKVLGGLAALILFLMMTLTFVDVIGRYFFNHPIPGGFEITEIMMATLIFLGLPLVSVEGGHITVDLLDSFIPAAIKRVQSKVVNLLSALVIFVISWQLWIKANGVAEYGDSTAILKVPLAPLVYFMSLMAGFTAILLVAISVTALKRALFSDHENVGNF